MYVASEKRYEAMKYNRCGRSGLMLPAVSLGLWHNFGDTGVLLLTTGSRTLTWPTTTARSRAAPRRTSAGS